MTLRLALVSGLCLWLGLSLLFSLVPAWSRPPLADRLRPFALGQAQPARRPPAGGFRQGLAVVAATIGETVSRAVGSFDDAESRLRRIHSPLSLPAFRMRQLGWAVAAVGVSLAVLAWLRPPAAVGLAALPAAVVSAYMLTEAWLNRACRTWDRRRLLELPIVVEQLAMLMAAGYSLGSALGRVAGRGSGACAMDLAVVCARIHQGVDERRALGEWANATRSRPVERLVAVLALSRDTSDLGALLAQESRSIRRQVQRQTVELMDRRAQQVWVPVTVAALVPGVVFLAVPFVQALRVFAGA
ncbi:MAG TPA: type II secretion system F family protein [Acidimicrobiales bacterium]|nr:type II secretion system F family protein [Acidimicrobiales bacterium]